MSTGGDSDEVEFVSASDLEAVQALFAKECDADGLMTKTALEKVPAIAEMLAEEICFERSWTIFGVPLPNFPAPPTRRVAPIESMSMALCNVIETLTICLRMKKTTTKGAYKWCWCRCWCRCWCYFYNLTICISE